MTLWNDHCKAKKENIFDHYYTTRSKWRFWYSLRLTLNIKYYFVYHYWAVEWINAVFVISVFSGGNFSASLFLRLPELKKEIFQRPLFTRTTSLIWCDPSKNISGSTLKGVSLRGYSVICTSYCRSDFT